MRFYKLIIKNICLLLNVIAVSAIAQESLKPLSGNFNLPIINSNTNKIAKTTSVTAVTLPFFDDFSYAQKTPYPNSNLWIDSNVYVNTGFAIAPLSIGVATFDGLNKLGYPYNISAPVSVSAGADTLTSKPILLQVASLPSGTTTITHNYSPADSVYFSFYYQAQGNGDSPEPSDVFSLDFFKPNQKVWKQVWTHIGYNPSASDTSFYRVMIPITDTAYFSNAFQFRFRNKGTTSGSLDHWHIDYVYMEKLRGWKDTVIVDVNFAYKQTSFLKNYSTMPFRQFEPLETAPGFRNFIRNNSNGVEPGGYNYTIQDGAGTFIPKDNYGTFLIPIQPFIPSGYYTGGVAASPVFTLTPFPIASFVGDSTTFTITHALESSTATPTYLKYNDTITHIQHFSNYYAYDDGAAEAAYYLNTYGAKTAVRFTLNKFDTLKAVRIFFDPVLDGALILNSYFRLMVWANGSGGPGSVIYKDSLIKPEYIKGGYNLMPTYALTSCLPLNAGTYYIGIQQTTDQQLNIGFDKNTNHMDALYYDIGNGWVQSAIPGSIMINPVMGCVDPPVGIYEYSKNEVMSLFPNPAQNQITISYPGNQIQNAILEIISSIGQTVVTTSFINNQQIDIGNLPNGMYLINIRGNNLNVSPKKLIISR